MVVLDLQVLEEKKQLEQAHEKSKLKTKKSDLVKKKQTSKKKTLTTKKK